MMHFTSVMTHAPRFLKTRIAPTPSGFLHLGNALSFLLTQQLAEAHGARILLRIDDMDRARVRPEYVQDVFDTLRFLGIGWDEGPRGAGDFEQHWSQLRRLELYNEALRQLANEGAVFACNCSRADILRVSPDCSYPGTCRARMLPLDTPGAAWRLRTDDEEPLTVFLRNKENVRAALPAAQRDFIVRKKDGFPAYQLSSVADDRHFGIDFVVRGEDLWDSTLAQLYLARRLGWNDFCRTTFVHHGLIADDSGEKLSKSAGATSIRHLLLTGAEPAAFRAQLRARLRELPLR
ncbi:glutamate--tRNA ligase family protein [Flaviaesturariibacter flavus]|nr:glutamate--tRNA ligase family protein [Flaviaesturariibacter flavus]